MTKVSRFRLALAARASLRSVGRYTQKTWGEMQRRKYIDAMDARFHDLATSPEKGRLRDGLSPGLRSYQEGKRVIFYRVKEREILIIDILHERMEPALHLEPKA